MNYHTLTLNFDVHTHHRTNDPDTSVHAAVKASRGMTAACQRVLAHLRSVENATDDEGAAATGMGDTYRKRRSDLKNAGLAERSGHRRPGLSGTPMIAWRAVQGITA